MTVPTWPPAAVRSAGSQTSTASRTPSAAGTYTDWRRRDVSITTPRILAQALRSRSRPPCRERRCALGRGTGRRCGARGSGRRAGAVGRRQPVRSERGTTIPAAAYDGFWLLAGERDLVEIGQVRRQAQRDHALLLLRVGAGDHGHGQDVAAVHREMRDAGRHVHEVPGPDHGPLHQALAVPDLGLAADRVDGGLVALVDVRHAPGPGGNRHQVQAQPPGARGLAAHAGGQVHALLAVIAAAGTDDDDVTDLASRHGGRVERPLPFVAYSEHLAISYP